jgi:polyhydroxyalkanoate synthesis regulator phasin
MLRRLSVLFSVFVLACVVVGCGDDEEPASGGAGATQTAAPEATEEASGGDVSEEQAQAFVDSCKEQIQAQASLLSDDLKDDLREICEKAASGDEKEAREAIVEVCVKVIEETVPEDSGRDEFAEQCKSAAP